jgi:hypothetical protein
MRECKETIGVLLVVCWDDVETILRHPQNFDDEQSVATDYCLS